MIFLRLSFLLVLVSPLMAEGKFQTLQQKINQTLDLQLSELETAELSFKSSIIASFAPYNSDASFTAEDRLQIFRQELQKSKEFKQHYAKWIKEAYLSVVFSNDTRLRYQLSNGSIDQATFDKIDSMQTELHHKWVKFILRVAAAEI